MEFDVLSKEIGVGVLFEVVIGSGVDLVLGFLRRVVLE